MILLIARSKEAGRGMREMLFTAAALTELSLPEGAISAIQPYHRGVILLGRDIAADEVGFVTALRAVAGERPIVAVRDDVNRRHFSLYDAVLPCSPSPSRIISELRRVALSRSLAPVCDYRLGGVDATAIGVAVEGCELSLTRTEAAIVRYLVAVHPRAVRARDILCAAFRIGRAPTEAGVRTHISAINKKAKEKVGQALIKTTENGYRVNCEE